MRREEYLYTLTEQIRCKMARGTIEQEINDHIEDQKAEFLSEGMSQTEAEEAAIREMGDPVEVGLEMDRIHRPTMAWGMIALIVGLSLAGYLLRSVMYQTALGIEQSAGKTEELFWTGMSSSWHTSLELPALLVCAPSGAHYESCNMTERRVHPFLKQSTFSNCFINSICKRCMTGFIQMLTVNFTWKSNF